MSPCQVDNFIWIYKIYTLPPYNYIGVFLYTPPGKHPPYPLPYSGGTYPPYPPPPFFLLYRGIIPSAKGTQKNSIKNFWEKMGSNSEKKFLEKFPTLMIDVYLYIKCII